MAKNLEDIITKQAKSSFYYTFLFLPENKRKAMHSIYAFCRVTDDIVDNSEISNEEKFIRIEEWKKEFQKALSSNSKFELLNSVASVIKNFKMSVEPFVDLIEGVKMDLTKNRYETFDELIVYCYRVASTIGLMSIELFGYKNPQSRDYAYNLGIAMQLTNILRDVKIDAENDRIYLPQEDLKRFNYSNEELKKNIYNDNFIELMKFESHRAEYFYQKANEYFHPEDHKVLAMGRAMQEIYYKILKKIEKNFYDVYSKNNNLNSFEKLRITIKNYINYHLLNK
ncbi:MAG: phytoene desaturase [Ignavibacterium sp.]|nr:MAG: phytoene desaturase [Ignavibacterium sp.]